MFYTKFAILFLLIYYPIRPLLVELFPITRFLGDLVILVLFFIHRKNVRTNYWIVLFFGLFLLTGVISAFLSGVSLIAILMQLRTFVVPFLLLIIMSGMEMNKKDLSQLLGTSFLMGCILSVQGLIEKISSRTVLVPEAWQNWELAATNSDRIYGLLANPNVLATYLMIIFFLSMYLKKQRLIVNIGLVLIAGTTILTYSRGTFIAFGIALLVVCMMKKYWKPLLHTAILFSLSFVVVYLPITMTAETDKISSERFTAMFSDETVEQSNNWGRVYVVKKGLEIWMDHPVIGTGLATYGSAATISFGSPIYDNYQIPPGLYTDNQHIQILVETGVIGTIFMFLYVYQLAKRAPEPYVIFLLVVALVGSAVYSMLEDKTFTLYFYLALGYALNMRRNKLC